MTGVKMSEMPADQVIDGSEMLLALDGTTSKTITTAKMAEHVIDELVAASVVSPATGDNLLAARGTDEKSLDLDAAGVYLVGNAFASDAVSPVEGTDVALVRRGGDTKTATLANIRTYVLDGLQATTLDISGLNVATLADTDKYLVVQDGTARKTAYTALAGRVHAGMRSYTAGLGAVSTLDGSDTLYVIQGATAKKIVASKVLDYIADTMMVEQLGWDMDAVDPAVSGDMLLVRRGSDTQKVDVDVLSTYIMAGAQAGILDISGLTSAGGLAGADLALVCQGGNPRKLTLTNLRSDIHGAFVSHVNGLNAATTTAANDRIYVLQGGTAKYVTPAVLAAYIAGETGDIFGPPTTTTEGNVPRYAADNKTLDTGIPLLTGVRSLGGGATNSALVSELAVRNAVQFAPQISALADLGEPIVNADRIVVEDQDSGENRYSTFTRIWTWITTRLQGLNDKQEPVDDDKFTIRDSEGADGLIAVTLGEVSEKIRGDVFDAMAEASSKATPVDADEINVMDSADDQNIKRTTVEELWSNRYLADAKAIRLDEFAATEDNTDLNASTDAHGLLKKLDGVTDHFLRGDGTWAEPGVAVGWDGDITDVDLTGGTDIGADLEDADLILVDAGASDTIRKSGVSRLWTYVWSKLSGTGDKASIADNDKLLLSDSADSDNAKTFLVSAIWNWLEAKFITLSSKNTGAITDSLILQDSAASFAHKRFTMTSLMNFIVASRQVFPSKAAPVAADILEIQDSDASWALKKVTITNLWGNRLLADAKSIRLDEFAATEDNTDLDATSSAHGLLMKLTDNTDHFLRGDGTWAEPAGGEGGDPWDGDIDDMDIAGGTDVGGALNDADLFVVDHGADGTIRKSELSRLKTYLDAGGVYDEIWIPAGAMTPSETDGATPDVHEYATNGMTHDVMLFRDVATEAAEFNIVMPPAWNRGTIKFKAYWSAAAGTTDHWIKLELEAGAFSNDDTFDAPTVLGGAQEVVDQLIANSKLHVTAASGALTVFGSPALGDIIHFKITRDHTYDGGGNALSDDLKLLGIQIQYQKTNTVAGW